MQDVPEYWTDAKQHLRAADPVMAELINRFEEPPLRTRNRLFETLVHSIIGQQISAQAAGAVWGRFLGVVGSVTPDNVAAASGDDLRAAGLSWRKIEYVQGLAERGAWIREQPWSELSNDEVTKRLCSLRGVGPWTAEMVMIFSLLRPDILPLGDIGVVRTMERLYAEGTRLDAPALEAIAEPWRPFRTVAVWYLWRSLDPEPVEY